ncbi:MAG: ABC transporter substrate-binding protein [Acidobacteria bacterium]|nr:MAG: ABC transporter substrate-binding protein [Acidobacteriota bacterium]
MMIKSGLTIVAVALLVHAHSSSLQTPSHGMQETRPIRAQTRFPVAVSDALGRTFTFSEPPRRIVSLSPGYTETLFALGVGDRVAGVDEYSDFPPETASKTKVGGAHNHNLEQIISLQPDLVVVLVERDDLINTLTSRGIPTLKLFPDDFENVLQSILLLGKVTGTEWRAREIVEAAKAKVNRVRTRVEGLPSARVFFELDGMDPSKPFTPGPQSFIGDMIRIAGGWNIAQDIRASSSRISLEAIVAADPEVIVLGDAQNPINPQTSADVVNRPGWSDITAVRKKAVYPVDNALFFRPGPRVVDGIETLARLFHPEAFR